MQDRHERTVIRNQYRTLLHEQSENRDEYLSPETGLVRAQQALDQTNELFSKVKMPREAAMDSQMIAGLAEIGVQHAQSLRTEFVVFQPNEFAQKLMTYLDVNRLVPEPSIPADRWTELGTAVQPCFRKAPVLTYMFGAFERGPPKQKKRAERRKAEKEVIVKNAVVPKQVTNIKDTERREATTEEVEKIFGTLHKYYKTWDRQPLCYFEFVINPTSFTQTIENIFYTSFLVRDGHVRIFLDDDKLPVIEPIEQREGETNTEQQRHQVVVSMSKAEWEEIIRVFNIEKPLIPTREPVKH